MFRSRTTNAKRRKRSAIFAFERLESRQMLAADFLYGITARSGVPDDYFGVAQAASNQFYVLGNPASYDGEPIGSFKGEVQIHDPTSGALLRTIANPDPGLGFSFGSPVAIDGEFLLVGAFGVDTREEEQFLPLPDLSGRAYLFNASTGELIHSFQDSYSTFRDVTQNLDGFGSSLAIEGNFVVIGAPGIDPAPQNDVNSDDEGHTYVFNRTTGELIRQIGGPGNQFGAQVGISQGKLFSAGADRLNTPPFFHYGIAHILDAAATSGPPLAIILPTNPVAQFRGRVLVDGNIIGQTTPNAIEFFSVSDGVFIDAIPGITPVDMDGNLLVTPVFGNNSLLGIVHDRTTEELVQTIVPPASMNTGTPFPGYSGRMTIHEDRVLVQVPSDGLEEKKTVYVFDLTNGPPNSPPTDIALTNNSIPENSANDVIVGTLSSIDATPGETFTYSLLNSAGGRFSIDGTQLRVANGSLLDFESDTSHNVTVEVTDSTGNTYSEVFAIQITNENDAPTDISLSNNSVSENSANATVVGTLTATDIDPAETFTFSLLSSAGGRFEILGNQIVVANGSALNFEASPFHNVTVQVTDSTNNSFSKIITILVTDVAEPPTDLQLTDRAVRESASNGAWVSWIDNMNPLAKESTDTFSQVIATDDGKIVYGDVGNSSVFITDELTGDLLHVIKNPTPSAVSSDFFGWAVAIHGDLVVIGAPQDDDLAFDAGRAYVFNATTGQLVYTLQHPNPGINDFFGHSVSISEDRIAVGARGDGSTFVFYANTGNLNFQIDQPGSGFGTSVKLTDNRLVVGDPSFANNTGRITIYDDTLATLQTTIDNPNPSNAGLTNDFFGADIEVLGNQLLTGAQGEDQGANDTGIVYVFNMTSGALLETLNLSVPVAGSRFGIGLATTNGTAAIGNGTSDGNVRLYNTSNWQPSGVISTNSASSGFGLTFINDGLMIGTSPNPGADRGQVFSPMTLQQRSGFRVSNPVVNDTYIFTLLDDAGGRFSLVGDQLVVANNSLLDAQLNPTHTVIVRVTNSAGLSLEKPLTINVINANEPPTDITLSNNIVAESPLRLLHNIDPKPNTLFGVDVAISGNLAAVSTPGVGSPPTQYGRVDIYNNSNGSLVSTLTHPNPVTNAFSLDGGFGRSVALFGSIIAIGAPAETVGGDVLAGKVFVFNATTGALLHTLTNPVPADSREFGSKVSIAGNLIAVGSSDTVGGFTASGAVHLFDAITGGLIQTIQNPNPAAIDLFGSLSLDVFGNTIVIGAFGDDFGASAAGRAYIYQFDPPTSSASLIAILNNPTPAIDDFFGGTVSISSNYVIVGAINDDDGATNSGVAYVFDRTTGVLLRTLSNPSPSANDFFAEESAAAGNYVLISARNSPAGSDAGEVHVFNAATGAYHGTMNAPFAGALDFLGNAMATDGTRIIVNSRLDDTDGTDAGLVYVYEFPFGQAVGTLSTTDPDTGDTFTYSLTNDADGRFAIDGNQIVIADATKLDFEAATSHVVTVQVSDGGGNIYTKDFTITVTQVNEAPQDVILTGNTVPETQVRFLHNIGLQAIPTFGYVTATDGELVVVGHNNLPSYNLSGEVSVYNKTTGELVAVLAAPSPELGELFGESIAISGNRVVVGARLRNTGVGVSYVFNATTGALLHTLNNPTPASSGIFPDNFGSAVAISGSLIAIGSEEDLGAPDSGAVYLFDATTGSLIQTIASPNPAIQSKFGNSLSLVANTLVIGASVANRAYVFEFNAATQSAALVGTLNVPPGGGVDAFGRAVNIVGNIIAVGAPNNDTTAANSGQVHLFDRTTGNLLRSLDNPSPAANDNFGSNLASNGTYLAVAAPFDDTDVADSGRVYIFDPSNGQLISSIANPTPNGGDFFSRVSFSGDTLVVGAPTDDADGANAGMVYIFDLPMTNTVGSLSITDPDAGDLPTYTLVNDADGRFGLVGNQIVVVDPTRLNFEEAASHSLLIQSTDSSGQSTFEALTIQVSNANEPPQNVAFTGDSVNENALNGTVVSSLSATDPDAASSTTYSLFNDAGGRFEIAGNTIIVANSGLLDFETSTSHTVIVRATDSGGKFVLETRRIQVIDILEATDFGDLPNSFGTTLAADGARHILNNTLRLGTQISSESDGQPSVNGNLDSGDDGVTLPFLIVPGLNASSTIVASQSGRLDAFIDFNGDGSFAETERITPVGGQLLNAGVNTLTFAVPGNASPGNQGARFRVSSIGGLGPIGPAADGEVEDYRVNIFIPVPLSSQIVADPEFPGLSMLYVRGSTNDDTIVVNQNAGGMRATINGVQGTVLFPTSRIVVFGLSGPDDLRVNGTTLSAWIDGGSGDDTIRGGTERRSSKTRRLSPSMSSLDASAIMFAYSLSKLVKALPVALGFASRDRSPATSTYFGNSASEISPERMPDVSQSDLKRAFNSRLNRCNTSCLSKPTPVSFSHCADCSQISRLPSWFALLDVTKCWMSREVPPFHSD